jgi:hypothetical protein
VVFARLWIRHVFVPKNFGTPELVDADGFHLGFLPTMKQQASTGFSNGPCDIRPQGIKSPS